MDFARWDQQLRDSLLDLHLSNEERDELRQLGSDLGPGSGALLTQSRLCLGARTGQRSS